MRIAVPYENENVFQHFGHTEVFKIYDVVDGVVEKSGLIVPITSGHDALAEFLKDNMVNVVICGGMGDGAMNALTEAGIEICTGVSGNADEAVACYLHDELISEGVNCEKHSNESEGCGCGCGCGSDEDAAGGCGGGCGGCGGGCGSRRPMFEGKNVGKTLRVHYRGTLNDGSQFDSSYDRNEPLEFVCGVGMMILGFDKAVAEMEPGEKVTVHLMPEEAYGMPDPNAVFTIEIAQIPGSEDLSVGEHIYLSNAMGQPFPVTVTAKDDVNITFDANHEMAGKELNFEIELVEIL